MALEHPAKFSAAVMAEVIRTLETFPPDGIKPEILDPFAGTGRIHELRELGYRTVGVELEPEWAGAHEGTVVGDATRLPQEWFQRFGAVVTSPPYGNRMADSYAGDAKGTRRHTYRIALKRKLTEGSAAGLQWGESYRAAMGLAIREIHRVLAPNGLFLLNISDHVRKGELQRVPEWYELVCTQAPVNGLAPWFELLERIPIGTPRNRHGANGELRASCEWLYVFHKIGLGSS